MQQILAGRVAIITGASRGLGYATAYLMAAAGAATVLVARSAERITEVAEELTRLGRAAAPMPLDISDADGVRALASRAVEAFGRIDFFINIAGAIDGIGKPAWQITDAECRELLLTNVAGPLFLSRELIPVMLRQGTGRILTLTSPAAQIPIPGAAAYGASKAAVNQFVSTLARELAGSGITVNAFNPGAVATATLRRVEEALQVPTGRWKTAARSPEEAAKMILWLCSPATATVSGQVIHWRDPAIQSTIAAFARAVGAE